MPYQLKAKQLLSIFTALSLARPPQTETVVFFGVRGAVPVGGPLLTDAADLDGSKPYDHLQMRCTIGQWWPFGLGSKKDESQARIALYRGSTVPTLRYIEAAEERDGAGANMVMPGLYTFYRGVHRAGTATAHDAFRELSEKLIVRTADDAAYEPESDRIEIDSPADNLHAAWGTDTFSSAGCPVVSGKPGEGQWSTFKDRGYAAALSQYRFLLLPSGVWKQLVADPDEPAIVIGSRGGRAKAVQEALIQKGFLKGPADGAFGCQSGLALLKWQRACSEVAADAICTTSDARALGIKDW